MQRLLRDSMVVQRDEAVVRSRQILGAVEVVRVERLRDAPVKALDHIVGLRVLGFSERVLDAQCPAQRIDAVLVRSVLGPLAEGAVGELAAVVGDQRAQPHGRSLRHRAQERARGDRRLVALDGNEYPARGPVDGHKHVAPGGFSGHLRHQKARVTAQTQQPIHRRAAYRWFDELVHHRQKVVQRQQQLGPQVDHQLLLAPVERGLQPERAVAGVVDPTALAPLADGVARDLELTGQPSSRCPWPSRSPRAPEAWSWRFCAGQSTHELPVSPSCHHRRQNLSAYQQRALGRSRLSSGTDT